ncbi:hypothetical protein LCGC14_2229470, partial [marine sediment metagenome]
MNKNPLGSVPINVSSSNYYFKTEKDSTDTNKSAKRIVSFVVDKYD